MRRLSLVLILLVAAACVPPPTEETGLTYTGLGLEQLDAYQATFEVRFEGDYAWEYQLETHWDGTAMAYDLHLEGVDPARNPGDVRVVIEGDTVRMRGPGTGDTCVQFPVDLGLAPSFFSPDDLIAPDAFPDPLTLAGTRDVAGVETTRYTSGVTRSGDWSELEVDVWWDDGLDVALRYDVEATGPDPLFDAGEGELSGQFLIETLDPPGVEPVEGCEIDLPLPADATYIVRLSGFVAFESDALPDEVVSFYRTALAEAGWQLTAGPEQGDGVIQAAFARNEQDLTLTVEASGEGSHVELLFDE